MHGFKLISVVAVLSWFLSTIAAVWLKANQTIDKDSVFQQQLTEMKGVLGENRIFIYGSSGVLFGISAESIESITGHPARNLATVRFGGQINLAISLMNPNIKKGDIVIIGDREFRDPKIKPPHWYDHIVRIYKSIPLIPNIRKFFEAPFARTFHGDFVAYSPAIITPIEYDPHPYYGSASIEIMRTQVDLVKQGGGCPVLVFVPLLVKQNERRSFESATSQLLALADSAGLTAHLLHTPSIETDGSLFTDQFHLSASGRDKWTAAIGKELLDRNMCNLALSR